MQWTKKSRDRAILQVLILITGILTQVLFAMYGGPGKAFMGGYQVTWVIRRLIGSMKFFFVAFLLIAYLHRKWKASLGMKDFGWLCGLHMVHFLVLFVAACAYVAILHILYPEYVLFLAEALFLYVVLPSVLASILGFGLGMIPNGTLSCAGAVLLVYIFTTDALSRFIFWGISSASRDSTETYYVWDVFRLWGGRTDIYDDYYYTISLGSVNYEKVLMWIFLAAALVAAGSRVLRKKWGIVLGLLAVAVCLGCLYARPASLYVVYEDCPFDSWDLFGNYTSNLANYSSTPSFFGVESYELQITLDRNMGVEATVQLDGTKLEQYDFVLNQGFVVKSITDIAGKPVPYIRRGEHLTICPNEDNDCSVMHLSYRGGNNYYIANEQCIYLTNKIFFYPIPLCEAKKQFDREPQSISHFDVKVDFSKKVYCNLEPGKDNHFSGDSEGVFLWGGMLLGETEKDGVRIVYPKLRWSEEEILAEYEKVRALYADAGYDLSGKDWFATTFRSKIYHNDLCNGLEYFSGSVEELNEVQYFIGLRRWEQ